VADRLELDRPSNGAANDKKLSKKWESRFWELARVVSEWSKDPRAQVGAVVVARRGVGAIALGYNGFPVGVEDSAERLNNKKIKLDMIVHAEQNALLIAGARAERTTLLVYGKPICARCAGQIIQAGVSRVVAIDPGVDRESSWFKTGIIAVEMLREAGVTVDFREP
jgi:dCMP deaminase